MAVCADQETTSEPVTSRDGQSFASTSTDVERVVRELAVAKREIQQWRTQTRQRTALRPLLQLTIVGPVICCAA